MPSAGTFGKRFPIGLTKREELFDGQLHVVTTPDGHMRGPHQQIGIELVVDMHEGVELNLSIFQSSQLSFEYISTATISDKTLLEVAPRNLLTAPLGLKSLNQFPICFIHNFRLEMSCGNLLKPECVRGFFRLLMEFTNIPVIELERCGPLRRVYVCRYQYCVV